MALTDSLEAGPARRLGAAALAEPLALAGGTALLVWLIWVLGHRQFGAFDFSILVETVWRVYSGQRPYHDFITTMPVAFYLGGAAAFHFWGPRWASLVAAAAAYSALTFLAHQRLLRRLLPWPLAAGMAFACQLLSVVLMSYWWYNCITLVAACLYLSAAFVLLQEPAEPAARAWYGVTAALLLTMKPNVACPLIALATAGLWLAPAARRPALAALVLAALADVVLLLAAGINPLDVLASYRSLVATRGLPQGSFFFLNHGEEAFVCLPLLLLALLPCWVVADATRRRAPDDGERYRVPGLLGLTGTLLGIFDLVSRKEDPYIAGLLAVLAAIPLAGSLPRSPWRERWQWLQPRRGTTWLALAGLACMVFGVQTNHDPLIEGVLFLLLLALLALSVAWRQRPQADLALAWLALAGWALVDLRIVTNLQDAAISLFLTLAVLSSLEAVACAPPEGGAGQRALVWLSLTGPIVAGVSLITNIDSTFVAMSLVLTGSIPGLVLLARDLLPARFTASAALALLAVAAGFLVRSRWLALWATVNAPADVYRDLMADPVGQVLYGPWLLALLGALGLSLGEWPADRWPRLRPAVMAWLITCACGLAVTVAAVQRWRIMYIGPFYRDVPLVTLAEPPFLAGMQVTPEVRQLLQQIGRVLQARRSLAPEPAIFFGTRLEFAYAAFGLPSPRELPTWWDTGTSYPPAMEGPLVGRFTRYAFPTCIFTRDQLHRRQDLYGIPRPLVYQLSHWYRLHLYPELAVYERLPAGQRAPWRRR